MRDYGKKIIAVVALYHPDKCELDNISLFIDGVDDCILMDDSEWSNETFVYDYLGLKKYIYCWNGQNIGLCASVNRGIAIAQGKLADWILLMNGDSKIDVSVVDEFRKYIKENDTQLISCLATQYNYDRHPRIKYDGTKTILWANMSGMCINSQCLDEVGVFDERFFIDGLDVDWGIRAKRAGYKMIELGATIMEHHPAETRSLKFFGKKIFLYGWASPVRYYYQFRSNYYMIKQYRSFEALKWQIIKLTKVLLLFDHKMEYFKMYKKAVRDVQENHWGKFEADKN